ncbi:MAG: FmdB family zinc ribbon protein [Nitrospiraceae bacterium]
MPLYEYRCEGCQRQFEAVQSVHARPEDTICPHCNAQKTTRLLSACATRIVGDRKPGFAEMKAYSMLNEKVDAFSKLPPMWGKRLTPTPDAMSNPGAPTGSDPGGSSGENNSGS